MDPTIRYEGNDTQATELDEEKRNIYEPCVPDLMLKYRIASFDIKVIGLYIGARGAVKPAVDTFELKTECLLIMIMVLATPWKHQQTMKKIAKNSVR